MRESIKHINSIGETLDFTALGVLINYNDLRDYTWSVKTANNKICGFEKGIATKTIPFIFACDEEKANIIKNRFFEHFEIDVLNELQGYFEINGYRLYCYAIKNKKSDYLINKGYLRIELEITSDTPSWKKETSFLLDHSKKSSLNSINNSKLYAFSYPYQYLSEKKDIEIMNDAIGMSDVIIRIFGPCANPFVKIDKNVYQVNISLTNEEYLEIKTEERTIYKISKFGDRTNVFNFRSKESSNFFSKIPKGLLIATSNAPISEIIILEQRSEPKWI